MKIKLLSVLIIMAMLAGCGTGKTSSKVKKPPLWEFIPNTSPIRPEYRSASFKLNSQAFIDSFVHFEAKTHGKVPDVKLLMPLPNLDGSTDDYYFSPIYDAGPRADTLTLGFIGINASNKKDITSLYIRSGRVIAKWKTADKDWILQNTNQDRTTEVYTLIDLQGNPEQVKRAPIPSEEY